MINKSVIPPHGLDTKYDSRPAPDPGSPSERWHPEGAPLKGMRVLIVDDDPAVRETLRLLTGDYGGAQVEACPSGAEALNKLQEMNFDGILLDLRMPGLTGQDTYHRLSPIQKRKVVFITGESAGVAARHFLKSTQQPALFKPIPPEVIFEALFKVTQPPPVRPCGDIPCVE